MTADVTITIEQTEGSRAVLAVSGDLGLEYAPLLRRTCLDLIDQGHPHLVLEVSRLTFCDSTCLNALLHVREQAMVRHGSLALAAVSQPVRRLLSITGADTMIVQYPTVQQALDAAG
jgi:anti-sigma B factor antagonist